MTPRKPIHTRQNGDSVQPMGCNLDDVCLGFNALSRVLTLSLGAPEGWRNEIYKIMQMGEVRQSLFQGMRRL